MRQYTLKEYLIILSECDFLRIEDKWSILKRAFPEIIDRLDFYWLERVRLSSQKLRTFRKILHEIDFDTLMANYQQGVHFITYFDPQYPKLLKETYAPPLILFYKGNLNLLNRTCLAIVGSRNHSAYSEAALKMIVPSLSSHNIVVVSGLARGVDTIAHKMALQSEGATIAVVATGLDNCYPYENAGLQEHLGHHQLVLSEYPPKTRAKKTFFPMRNRIIAGISRGTLVTEAKEKSGSLITARFALEEGRDVFALPGQINQVHSKGCNQLISQGAIPIIDENQVIKEWDL